MGIEIDIRTDGQRLICHHDAFKDGEPLENILKAYRHALLILNTKVDGIDQACLDLLKAHNIANYFFLDLAFPTIIRLIDSGERGIALRYSEHEPLEQCLLLKDKVDWVWIDCFHKLPLNDKIYRVLSKHFRICLVSPELQKHPLQRIREFAAQVKDFNIDAVCTKRPDLWQAALA